MKFGTAYASVGILCVLTGLLLAVYYSGVPRISCTDTCPIDQFNMFRALNDYYDRLAILGLGISLIGLMALILGFLRPVRMGMLAIMFGGFAALGSGFLVSYESVHGLSNNLLAVNEKFGFPFVYRTIWCATGSPSYCIGGQFSSFSWSSLIADVIVYALLASLTLWFCSQIKIVRGPVSESSVRGRIRAEDPTGC